MKRGPKRSKTREAIDEMLRHGFKADEIVSSLRCSPTAVSVARKALDIPCFKRGRKPGMEKNTQIAASMAKTLIATGFTMQQVATQLGCSRQRVDQIVNPEKRFARAQAYRAFLDGKIIKPQHCEKCGRIRKLQMHHADYSKPLEVRWLCMVECHIDADRDLGKYDRARENKSARCEAAEINQIPQLSTP